MKTNESWQTATLLYRITEFILSLCAGSFVMLCYGSLLVQGGMLGIIPICQGLVYKFLIYNDLSQWKQMNHDKPLLVVLQKRIHSFIVCWIICHVMLWIPFGPDAEHPAIKLYTEMKQFYSVSCVFKEAINLAFHCVRHCIQVNAIF